jgi:hypothetical protein
MSSCCQICPQVVAVILRRGALATIELFQKLYAIVKQNGKNRQLACHAIRWPETRAKNLCHVIG